MFDWFAATLRQYPEIAIFLSLGIGYYAGQFTIRGIGLGSVTSTLLAAILIGQIGITISPNVKSVFFLMFLFAVGYGVGPQFVRGIAKDGIPQALFSVVVCVFCLGAAVLAAKLAGYDMGYAAGPYAGSQTISASMGLATDAMNRLGLPPDQAKGLLDSMPIAYAVSYIFGTVGSAILLALIGPKLLRIDLVAACKAYEERQGGGKELGGAGSAWHRWAIRAFQVQPGGRAVGLRAIEAEALVPDARVFVLRIRRNGKIEDAAADTVLKEGDTLAVAGVREVLVKIIGANAKEVEDPELLSMPVEGVDVYVTSKAVDGKTLAELAQRPVARGVFLRKITRGAVATSIPILPNTTIQRGDIVTLVGRTQDTAAAAKDLGVPDRPTDVADVAFIGGAITLGALVGALVWKVGGVPLTLSTAGGALIAGLVFGWLRSTRPFFGRIPSSTVWFMNSVGLNVFIAVVGIASGPGFVELRIDRGDVMTLIGTKLEVERAAKLLGYPDWPTNATDMVFVGTGIVLGGLVGLLSVTVAGLPLTLTSSGGALIMGLVFGWLRSVMPIFGRMPEPAIWIFDTVGLCTFIGVVGLSAGPGFVAGLQKTGISLVLMGLVCSLVPHTVAILFGRYVLRMNPLILLGACAGAGTITAALRAIEDEAQSKVPALGYTVPYAVGNILLTAWGPVIVALMSMGR